MPLYKYFGVDLDNTLHNFKSTSKKATNATLEYLSNEENIPKETLYETYREMLRYAVNKGFNQNKSSKEYRTERFQSVLDKHNLESIKNLSEMLRIYEETFISHIEAYTSMIDSVRKIHALGMKTVLISEGPKDAQERTIEAIDLKNCLNFVILSSEEETSKTEGLFKKTLEKLDCQPKDMLYVGDSKERDIKPAKELGINTIWFNPDASHARQAEECLSRVLH